MSAAQQQAASQFRSLLAAYREHADLISIGAYRQGSNPLVDEAITMRDAMNGFLRQCRQTGFPLEVTRDELLALMAPSLHAVVS
jgi:flagellum-specific ATP synthase